jgi:type I restriction enzyme, S subunit
LYLFSNHLTRIRTRDTLNPLYLLYWIRSLWQAEYFKDNCTKWVNQAAIRPEEMLFTKDIFLPPTIEEQEVISRDLHTKFTRIENMRQAAIIQKEAATALKSAILQKAFSWRTGDSLPVGWQWKKIRSFATVIRGASPRPKGSPFFFGGSVPRLMVADVTRDGMYVTPKIDSLTEEGAKRSRPMKAGSLVIQVSGNPGTPSILKIDCCIHDGFAGLVGVDENKYHIPYIYFYLETIKDISSKDASGGIWENLDTTKIKELSIPFPETKEQQEEITNRISETMEHMTKLMNSCDTQLATIDILPAAILRETFNPEINEN